MSSEHLPGKNDQATHRIKHQYASYSTTNSLLCTLCNTQIRSESLWNQHLQSTGHTFQAGKQHSIALEEPETTERSLNNDFNKKKRKASVEEDSSSLKRSKLEIELLENSSVSNPEFHVEQLPISARTFSQTAVPDGANNFESMIDEDEWAAFEADVALDKTGERLSDWVISAPPVKLAEDIKKANPENEYLQRKEQLEQQIEADKEDALQKIEEEYEKMENLEARVKRLRARREELRKSEYAMIRKEGPPILPNLTPSEESESDYDDDDDGWYDFRLM
ncbi:BgTH12-06265 [Blumeria graminis f. sp. triticale]|uniref:Bgt-4135 n=3 Tax=Blumeria graminis TaxID=34373 RepID=A0A061HIA6_BLUGR|nr:hypothetical protein BGT96224_4135 [Blumeria graminis f. sp. tritici 96224]CAD6500555.1 BgTH12-06265 [Blumeria graminis f. sp. triticale]VCU40821.1 Bgt-4135 [Blumeria graminis f. sp. tritici]